MKSIINLFRTKKVIYIIGVALMIGGASTAIAFATIPDSSGIIHGCYSNRSGTLRVIDTGSGGVCAPSKETALNWNQTGPAVNGSEVIGNKTIPANTSDPTLFSISGFGTVTAANDNGSYCRSDENGGMNGYRTFTNTTSNVENLWVNGLNVALASGATYTISTQAYDTTILISNPNSTARLISAGAFNYDSVNNITTSCSYAWSYAVN